MPTQRISTFEGILMLNTQIHELNTTLTQHNNSEPSCESPVEGNIPITKAIFWYELEQWQRMQT